MSVDNRILIKTDSHDRDYAVSSTVKFQLNRGNIAKNLISKKANLFFKDSYFLLGARNGAKNKRSGTEYSEIIALNKGEGFFETGNGGIVPKRDIFTVIKLARADIIEFALELWGNKRITIRNYRNFIATLAQSAIEMIQIYVRANMVGFPAIAEKTKKSRVIKTHPESPMFDTGDLLDALEYEIYLK